MTRLGFAGVGWLGESLLKELPRFPSLELVAVQDTNLDLVAQVAERYASPWYGAGYAELLALPTVDAVVICTPNALHASQAKATRRGGATQVGVSVIRSLAASECIRSAVQRRRPF